MAEKLVFIASNKKAYEEEVIEYTYYSGFAVSQKQKSINSLHESIKLIHPNERILEISTKSLDGVGVKLSAFNLMFYHQKLDKKIHLENVFQSSKVFENGGPYRDLLNVKPKDAKRDERLVDSGRLIGFDLDGIIWPLEPKTMFYDWIYINALMNDEYLSSRIIEYDIFTDIEFNHKKSINSQARSAAIYVSLVRQGILEEKLSNTEAFKTIYEEPEIERLRLI